MASQLKSGGWEVLFGINNRGCTDMSGTMNTEGVGFGIKAKP
jgi:hypothetical protein